MIEKKTGKGRCGILIKTENHAMCTDVPKEFILNGGQRKKFRKAEGRSGEMKEIHDLKRELKCQTKKRTTKFMTDINEADMQRAALLL